MTVSGTHERQGAGRGVVPFQSSLAINLPKRVDMHQGWQDDANAERDLDERRVRPRHELTVEVTFESRHNFYSAVSQDLSANGLFVATDSLLPVGECIRVRFSLPDSPEVMDAIAEIRWIRRVETLEGEPGIGLEFLQLSPKTKQAIKAFVEKREALTRPT